MNFKKKVSGSWVDAPYYLKGTDTETITTLPATIYPLAQTATLGLKGNTVQNGTPTPQSPVMPQGTGERTGNLFDISSVTHQTLGTDGSLVYESAMNLSGFIKVDGNYTVSWSAVRSGAYMRVSTYDDNKNFIARIVAQNTYTRSSYSNTHTGYIRINYENSYQLSDVQVNTGSTALPYEPYGYKIPISSASTTTSVYLGEVETTRKIRKLVFDGTENWQKSVYGAMYLSPFKGESYKKEVAITSMNSHFAAQINTTSGTNQVENNSSCFFAASGSAEYYIGARSYATADDFKAYLAQQYAAGTPVTVWYVLAIPQTGIVNEPLMKIGDYADSLTTSIPVTAGENTLDVQTTVQPSEVTAGFSGWHPVTAAHERSGGSWT